MAIPLASYPPASVRATFPADQWAAVLQSWITALTHLLQLPDTKFTSTGTTDSVLTFIFSYLQESPTSPTTDAPALLLRKKVFQLLHRLLNLTYPPKQLLSAPNFLISYIRIYAKAPAAIQLLDTVQQKHEITFSELLAKLKGDAVTQIRKRALTGETTEQLSRAFAAYPKIAAIFLAGDEFVEAVVDAGDDVSAKLFARAMLEAGKVNWTVVMESAYTLTTSGGEPAKRLLVKLAGYGIGNRMKKAAEGSDAAGRIAGVSDKIQSYAVSRPKRRKADVKGKGKARGAEEDSFMHEAEIEMDSKVASIRDLFPDLGPGFVRRCLEALGGDVEVVTSHLLEDSLPAELATADRSEQSYKPAPRSPPTAPRNFMERRNKFDDDELDRLDPSSRGRLTLGRSKETADSLLSKPDVPKSAIMAALALIDPDEDERDDTYDEADIGAALEASTEAQPMPNEDDERKAWNAYRRQPDAFERSARGSNARRNLKDETGWTDEALEGFSIMLKREPERASRLDRKWDATQQPGQNVVIQRSRWQAGDEETRGGFRGRGRGGFRGGFGRGAPPFQQQGQQGGPSNGPPTGPSNGPPHGDGGRGRARHNKPRGANHNRRDQRAKKVARGGFGPGPE